MYAVPLMITDQDLSDVNDSEVTVPALYAAEPTTNWLLAVAVAARPKITD